MRILTFITILLFYYNSFAHSHRDKIVPLFGLGYTYQFNPQSHFFDFRFSLIKAMGGSGRSEPCNKHRFPLNRLVINLQYDFKSSANANLFYSVLPRIELSEKPLIVPDIQIGIGTKQQVISEVLQRDFQLLLNANIKLYPRIKYNSKRIAPSLFYQVGFGLNSSEFNQQVGVSINLNFSRIYDS